MALAALPAALFGIPWTAFAVFWTYGAAGGFSSAHSHVRGAPGLFFYFFPLWGVPFILVGLGMLSAPYWSWRRARQTCYALTDRRAFILEPGWMGSVRTSSYEPSALGTMSRSERADGSGDLVFDEVVAANSNRGARLQRRGFLGVGNVREVEDRVRSTLLRRSASQ